MTKKIVSGKTLILPPIGLGNFLMVLPSLRFLATQVGSKNLEILALKPAIRDLARASGYFNRIYFWDPDKQSLSVGVKTLLNVRRGHFRYSLALFPTGHWKFSLFHRMAGAKIRYGLIYPHNRLPQKAQSHSFHPDFDLHDVDQNFLLMEKITGISPLPTEKQLFFPLKPVYSQPEKLSTRYYVLHPGSSEERGMDLKRLPLETYAEIVGKIHQHFGLKAVLVGGPEERQLREKLTSLAPGSFNSLPTKSLAELAAVVKHSLFYLGNDSGIMHVAVSLNKPCAAVFGPTDPKRTGPYPLFDHENKPVKHLVLQAGMDCAPCWTAKTLGKNPPCKFDDVRCLRNYSPEKLWYSIVPFIESFL